MAKENVQHNIECKSELHNQHLCYFVSQGFHLSETPRPEDIRLSSVEALKSMILKSLH